MNIRQRLLAAMMAAAALALSGCGGGGTSTTSPPSSAATTPARSLAEICKAVEDVNGRTFLVETEAASATGKAWIQRYRRAAADLRRITAGTPIEAQAGALASWLDRAAAEGEAGRTDSDTTLQSSADFATATQPLLDACS